MNAPQKGFTRDVTAALIALLVLLIVFQYRTLANFIVLPPGVAFSDLGLFVDTVRREVALDAFDAILALAILLPLFYMVFVEARHKRLTDGLAWVFADERRTVVALGITSLVCVRYYFAPGFLSWAGDAPQHISYLDITTQILADFELPIWTNYFGAGSPFLQFYGFLYFLVAGVLNLVLRDVDLAAKVVLGLSHAASGLGVYAFCRSLLGSRRASFLAGLGYVLCFWHAQHVIVMGRHPLGLFYALLPWTYVFVERSLRDRSWYRHAVSGGICHALLVLTHPGYGLYATAFLALYAALRGFELKGVSGARRGVAVVVTGLILSAPHTLPMYLERGATQLSLGWSLAAIDGPTLHHLLTWSNYRFRILPLPDSAQHWYGGYLGLSLVVVAVIGIVCALRTRSRKGWPRYFALSVCACLAVLMPFVSSSELLQSLPLISNLSSVRYLLFTAFFLSVAAGVGARFLVGASLGRDRLRRFVIVLGLVVLDLGPTTFQQPYIAGLPEPAEPLADGELANYRNCFLLSSSNPYNAMARSQLILRTPTARAPHPGDLLVQTQFFNPLEQALSQVLPDSLEHIDWASLDTYVTGFRMLNVRHIYLRHPYSASLDWHSPVLVSSRTVSLPPWERQLRDAIPAEETRAQIETLRQDPKEADWVDRSIALLWTLSHSTIDYASGACANIVLGEGAEAIDLGTDPACTVKEHRVWHTRVRIRLEVTEQCFARLAYGYFPFLRVTVNGREVEPLVTMGRFMALPLDAGEHTIEIEADLSPLRKALWVIVIALLTGWFGWGRRRLGETLRSG